MNPKKFTNLTNLLLAVNVELFKVPTPRFQKANWASTFLEQPSRCHSSVIIKGAAPWCLRARVHMLLINLLSVLLRAKQTVCNAGQANDIRASVKHFRRERLLGKCCTVPIDNQV